MESCLHSAAQAAAPHSSRPPHSYVSCAVDVSVQPDVAIRPQSARHPALVCHPLLVCTAEEGESVSNLSCLEGERKLHPLEGCLWAFRGPCFDRYQGTKSCFVRSRGALALENVCIMYGTRR